MSTSTKELSQLIESRLDLLQQLSRMALEQEKLVEAKDSMALLQIAARKESLLQRLVDINSSLRPFAAESTESRVWESDEARDRCRQNQNACEGLVQHLRVVEQRVIDLIESQQDNERASLQHQNRTAQARAAYAMHAQEDVAASGHHRSSAPDPASLDLSN